MNQNISNYLDAYLKQETTSYATLLTGAWGCGKTYFIKNYIKHYQEKNPSTEENKYQFVYISLFGLKEIGAIYEQIFQSLHPVLSSKPVKLVGGILKTAAKFAVPVDLPVDLNKNGSTDAKLNLNIDLEKLLSWDKHKQNTKNLFFVFDDLERTLIETKEILGFINNLTEHENRKVILIANEDEIKDENEKIFNLFKEKVVNKSFVIQNNHNEYWDYFREQYQSYFSEEQIEQIKAIFIEKGNKNFRTLNQVVDNFLIFSDTIDKKFKENTEFYGNLISQFFPLSFSYHKNNSCQEFGNIINAFSMFLLFLEEDWKKIIADFYHNTQELNEQISKMAFFQLQENWVQLWYYSQKTSEEFYSILDSVKDEFKNLEYGQIEVVIHVFSLLIYFIKNQIITDLKISDVEEIVLQYMDIHKHNQVWLNYDVFDRFANSTGFEFQNSDDADVVEIKKKMQEVLSDSKQQYEEKKLRDDLNILVDKQFLNSEEGWRIFEKYRYTSILDHLDLSRLMPIAQNYLIAKEFIRFLNARYATNYKYNGQTMTEVLADELPTVKAFAVQLNHAHANANPFEKLCFQEIQDRLDEIIKRFD